MSSPSSDNELIIHVVCHTHDDPGWLWTLDDYYMGTDHCKFSVKRILDNMVVSLSHKKERKFSYVEMSFFKRWYDKQTDQIKQTVKDYIKEGRLEIINGGWVMHDEAGSYYKHSIDNMRLGLKFLKEEFNITPKIGWFIDPFGHSSATSHILKQMNFDKIVLTRIDYLERKDRINNHNLEFIYDPFGLGQEIFTHISYHHYNPRKILRNYPGDKKIVLNDEELKDVCEKFYEEMLEERVGYRTNNILLYYGEDFAYNEADINYENIEMIMDYVNNNMKGKMKMIYSTPSQYFDSVLKSGVKFDKHINYDFFPYADNAHCYWTGYFSSRANLKGLIKQLGLYINIINKLLFQIFMDKEIMKKNKKMIDNAIKCIYLARENLGVLQHHDAVTGTSKEKTNKDYENMAIIGVEKIKKYIYMLINSLYDNYPFDASIGYEEGICICDKKENECENNFMIINPGLNNEYVFNYRINNYDGLKESYEYEIKLGEKTIFGNNISFYDVDIGLKYSSIQFGLPLNKENLISSLSISKSDKVIKKQYFSEIKDEKISIKNNSLIFDPINLKFIKDKNEFSLSHGYYTSYDGSNSKVRPEKSNPDGAYIFAPCEDELQRYESINKNKSFIQQNEYYTSIVLRYPNSYLIIIIKNDNLNIYTESIFDPIPRKSEKAFNYLLVLDSNINNINKEYSQPEIYTDSQGINMLKRIKDTRPNYKYEITEKITSNFYPITSVVSLHETVNENNMISIYSDRAQSVGVIEKGQIQIICQRFSTVDDWKGVGEPLYENSSSDRFFPVKHFISFDNKNHGNYFNKIPLLLSIENVQNNLEIKDNLLKIYSGNEDLDIEFEVKKYGEIYAQIGNVYCDYFKGSGKNEEVIKFNLENGKICEYNLNGVEEMKEIKNGEEINIKQQVFKSFLIDFK